jgi:Carboxypeptidase regulatory-like domain
MNIRRFLCAFLISVSFVAPAIAQQFIALPPRADITGTVTDAQDDVVSGATIVLNGPAGETPRTVVTNDNGAFEFNNVNPGGPYHITISAHGFANWTSESVVLKPRQFLILPTIQLVFLGGVTSVIVHPSSEQLATEQLRVEEQQRVLGFVPNFYVVYDPDAAPLTTKMKFSLARKVAADPVTFLGAGLIAGVDQAAGTPNFVQGAKGYGQRFGANYANGLTDIMIGGAILPSLLHQDPRYFYQGTGTKKSRLLHAISTPFICKGDNGSWQPNYSGLGGYVASGAIANTYYPQSNRGPGLVFSTTGVDIAADMANGLLQEFVLRKLTGSAKSRNQ